MTEEGEINIFAALNFIRDNAATYAKAKADRVYLEEYRRTKRAVLMQDAEMQGHKSAAAQEREAYAHPEYIQILEGLRAAVEEEEKFRWLIVAAQAKVAAWQTIEATRRLELKVIP